MQTTGSRLRLQFPPGVLRLLVGATVVFAVLAILAGNSGAIMGKAHAGVVAKVTVNSTSTSDDGDCEGPPNDNIVGGDCTLIEAINDANEGLADVINFQPSLEAVINVTECLPDITRSGITIDTQNSGLILDGDADFDNAPNQASPITCDGAIHVSPSGNGFDFTILGGKNLIIRNFDGDGIDIDGNDVCGISGGGCGLGNITIDGVVIYNITGDGIRIKDVREARNVAITHNDITASYPTPICFDPTGLGRGPCLDPVTFTAGTGVDINIDKCFDQGINSCVFDHDQLIKINDNQQIVGDEKAVDVTTDGDIGNPATGAIANLTVQVNGNGFLNALPSDDEDEAVQLTQNGCIAKSKVIFQVNDNTRITSSGEDVVDLNVNGGRGKTGRGIDDCQIIGDNSDFPKNNGSDHASVTMNINDNGNIRNVETDSGADGISLDVFLCCGEDPKGSVTDISTITIDGNGNIIGDQNGIMIQTDICCGDDSTSTIDISDNGEITGRNDEGVDVDQNYVGETRNTSDGADGNTAETTINNNDRITGVDSDAIYVDQEAGVVNGTGSADDNISTVTINGNRRIDGDSYGLDIYSWAISCGGGADSNTANITANDNEQISGNDNDGAYLDAEAGSLSFFNCNGTGQEGDDNETTILVQGNDRFVGGDGSGIYTFSFAGGDTKGSERNTNNTTVTENGSIEGEGTGADDDGIHVQDIVCCSSRKSNVNNTTITSNDKIIGHDGDGVDIDELCCSAAHYVTNISDNGRITGGGDDGIEYDIELGDCNPGGSTCEDIGLSEDLKQDGFYNTLSDLTISHNLIEDSSEDGIYVCCGPFENADQDVKSVINDNIITTNLDHGIEIDSAFGLNIVHNEIFKNGDDSALDAGIEINNRSSVFEMAENMVNVVPANHNRITDNSIYDNRGLGIDLAADRDAKLDPSDGEGHHAIDHGVGCKPKSDPINPNDCDFVHAPTFKTQAGNKLVGHACSLCIVEIFEADDDPSDNSPKDPHHGEGVGSDVFADHSHYYLASASADADGNFSINLPCGLGAMDLTATSTDKVKNTSEFSLNTSTLGTGLCAPPTNTPTNTPVPTTPAPTAVPTTPPPVPTNTNTPVPPPPTATFTPVITKACGDVNDNGSVDAVDAQLVLQYKAGLIATLPNLPSADVNNSGEVTSVDAALILQVEAGLIPLGSLHCS